MWQIGGEVTDLAQRFQHQHMALKQGCVLSPLLFNLYMSDFTDIFDSTCDPVTLKDSNLSCLMFADDVVLMSESSQGLQHCLNRLASYCNKWNLTINTSKTKIIVFNRGGHKISRFRFLLCDTKIDVVQDYTYLGIVFSSCGSSTKACKALRDKAFRRNHQEISRKYMIQQSLRKLMWNFASIYWVRGNIQLMTQFARN